MNYKGPIPDNSIQQPVRDRKYISKVEDDETVWFIHVVMGASS